MSENQSLVARPTELLPATDTLNAMMALAERVAKSGISPHSNPSTVLSVMLTGRELGVPVMASLRLIHVINNRTALAAELMASLITRDHGGDALRYETPDAEKDKQATFSYRRSDWPAGQRSTYTYDIKQAEAAKLTGKEIWKAHTAAMLRARCIAGIARIAFADTTLGMYSMDEAREINAMDEEIIDARPEPQIVERPNGKKANTVTGEIVDDNPAIGTPVDPHAALRAQVAALLKADKDAAVKLPKTVAEMTGDELQKTLVWLQNRNRRAQATASQQPEEPKTTPAQAEPLPENLAIEFAIEQARTEEDMQATVGRIADLEDEAEQDRLMALWHAKQLPASTAVGV